MCPAAEDAERVERRHTWVPPYRETYKVCVGAALCPVPTQGKMISMKNVIPRSAATWESVSPVWQVCSVRVLRIATPACVLVRNDIFGECGACRAAGFIDIVDDEFLPRSGRFGHPANFYNFFIMGT